MTNNPDIVERLRHLAANATPGPWSECGHDHGGRSCGFVFSIPADVPVAKVTIGPWGEEWPEVKLVDGESPGSLVAIAYTETMHYGEIPEAKGKATAAFIAAANPVAVTALLDEIASLRAEVATLRERKDEAYTERNKVVATIAHLYPSGTKRTDIPGWDQEWHGCVYIDMPTGQVSWHYHDTQAHLFADLSGYAGEWDGHDTEEKYRRLAALRAPAGDADLVEVAAGAVVDADKTMSGYHESHIAVKSPAARAVLAAIAPRIRASVLEEAAKVCDAKSNSFLDRRDALRFPEESRLRMTFERIATECRSLATAIRALGGRHAP